MQIKLLTLLLCICLLTGCTASQQPSDKEIQLRVLAWNIWHGGHSKAYPEQGCNGVLGILKKSEADVIIMVETYGSSDHNADTLGYYHRLLSSNLSIYSRYPIVRTMTYPDSISTFNFGGVEIDVNGKPVRIYDTWLHYLPDARLVPTDKSESEILAWDDNNGTRDEELSRILSVLRPALAQADSIPIIMAGDFNSHSHLDWTESTKNMYNHGGAVVNWTISKMMERAGFIDSFRELNPDATTHLGTTWYWSDGAEGTNVKDRQDRIDYIYYKGSGIKAIESESYNGDLGGYIDFKGDKFFYASDHGFVMTTFSIK